MEAPQNKPLSELMAEILAEARQFQTEHPDLSMVNAVLNHLMARVEDSFAKQQFQTTTDCLRNIKEVMAGPEPREHVSGQVQIVTAASWEEAKEQCPWACRFQPVGKKEHQKGKWICFESNDDANTYRELQD